MIAASKLELRGRLDGAPVQRIPTRRRVGPKERFEK